MLRDVSSKYIEKYTRKKNIKQSLSFSFFYYVSVNTNASIVYARCTYFLEYNSFIKSKYTFFCMHIKCRVIRDSKSMDLIIFKKDVS